MEPFQNQAANASVRPEKVPVRNASDFHHLVARIQGKKKPLGPLVLTLAAKSCRSGETTGRDDL